MAELTAEIAELQTRLWVEKLVVGLNLCPFARGELARGRVRFAVSPAASEEALIAALELELELLNTNPEIETTLLIHPWVLADFFSYTRFLPWAERLLGQLGLKGTYQIASFHPRYQFAFAAEDAVENHTNRSPYPMLHLLREASLELAIASHPDTQDIPRRNIAMLNRLGAETVLTLREECLQAGGQTPLPES